jgi:hypothetical protein
MKTNNNENEKINGKEVEKLLESEMAEIAGGEGDINCICPNGGAGAVTQKPLQPQQL